ncbi:hypothetical protein B0J17DRAFT_649230 [Rhizoctonia solani]|nr:hypothetical protein B0J17DRAFT_649230 [Rhizoctonia solani]
MVPGRPILTRQDPSPDSNGKPTYVVDYPAPKYPSVFPPGTRAVQKITSDLYMNQVGYMVLPVILPLTGRPGFLDERGREHFLKARQEIFKRFPTDTAIGSKYWGDIHEKWNWFGDMLDLNEEGPFVTGKQISFTNFAIGGGEMQIWKAISEWQGGRWARHWAEIEKLEKDSSEIA